MTQKNNKKQIMNCTQDNQDDPDHTKHTHFERAILRGMHRNSSYTREDLTKDFIWIDNDKFDAVVADLTRTGAISHNVGSYSRNF